MNTKKLTAFDTYKANQFITEPEETELSRLDKRIAKICKAYNVVVTGGNATHTLKSVPVARSIMKRDGEAGLQGERNRISVCTVCQRRIYPGRQARVNI